MYSHKFYTILVQLRDLFFFKFILPAIKKKKIY